MSLFSGIQGAGGAQAGGAGLYQYLGSAWVKL